MSQSQLSHRGLRGISGEDEKNDRRALKRSHRLPKFFSGLRTVGGNFKDAALLLNDDCRDAFQSLPRKEDRIRLFG